MGNAPLVFFLLAALLGPVRIFAQAAQATATPTSAEFADRLNKNRYQLTVENGQLSGAGLPILKDAVDGAQVVLVGEDHGIAQIPALYSGLCGILGPAGFHTMAVETGPLAADALSEWIVQADGRKHLVDFEQQYPESIAFYNWSEEYDLLSRCASLASGGEFRLWGLDQELMGSSRLILSRILEQHPGPDATREVQRLLEKNDKAHAAAVKSGSPGDMFMFAVTDGELAHVRDLLHKEGNAGSQLLLSELIASREIYQKNMDGRGAESNRQRALLMKHNFLDHYHAAGGLNGTAPKVMFKFGAWHMFKGINPLHNNDLGNFVTELSDAHGSKSVRILILAVRGSQSRFAGIGRPFEPAKFDLAEDQDSDFHYLKPMFAAVEKEGFTMFDLRGLRQNYSKLGTLDTEMDRLIFGYDLLVLVPSATPSKGIQ